MVGIVALIALNLALGYALALYLHRPELLPLPWYLLPQPALEGVAGANEGAALHRDEASRPGDGAEWTEQEVIDEQVQNEATAPVAQQSESPLTEKLAAIELSAQQHRAAIDEIDDRLRDEGSPVTKQTVDACLTELESANNRYLTEQEAHTATLREHRDRADVTNVANSIAAAQKYADEVESSRAEISAAAQLADAAAACRAFLLTTSKLTTANDALQDEFAELRGQRKVAEPPAEITSRPPVAATTEAALPTASRQVNLDSALADFLQKHQSLSGKFCVALAEVDQLADINTQHGRSVGDRLLQAVVKLFVAQHARSTAATHLEAQQFLFFLPDTTARDATTAVEKLRQQTAAAEFSHDGAKLPATVTCGVVEAEFREAPPEIIARLRDTLREAQRYGRNRTFFHEGQHAAPAIPPTVAVESRAIAI